MAKERNLESSAAVTAISGSAGQVIKLLVNFTSLIVLARILSPEDYGLTALAFAIIGVAELVRDMGLSTASIRAPHLSQQERDNLWWINSGLGFACTIVCFLISPLVAYIYDDSRYILIIMSMSLVFTFSGMMTQYRCDLIRKLKYGRLTTWEFVASVIALIVAITIGMLGGGYWALIAQQVLNAVIGLIGVAFLAGWRPKRYDRSTSVKQFFSYGMPLFASTILSYLGGNLDTVLISKFQGSATLGYYNRANLMVRMPMNQIRNPIGNVILATLSKVVEDQERYKRSVAKAQVLFLYPIVFLSVWIAITSHDIIMLLLGDKWAPSIILVTIMAVGDAVTALSTSASWVYLTEAKNLALFRLTIYTTVLRIILILALAPFGVEAVAFVYVLTSLVLWPGTYLHCQKTTGFKTMPLFKISLRVVLVIGVAASSAYFASSLPYFAIHPLLHLLATSFFYLIFVLGIGLLLKPTRTDLQHFLNIYRSIRPQKPKTRHKK